MTINLVLCSVFLSGGATKNDPNYMCQTLNRRFHTTIKSCKKFQSEEILWYLLVIWCRYHGYFVLIEICKKEWLQQVKFGQNLDLNKFQNGCKCHIMCLYKGHIFTIGTCNKLAKLMPSLSQIVCCKRGMYRIQCSTILNWFPIIKTLLKGLIDVNMNMLCRLYKELIFSKWQICILYKLITNSVL